LLPRSSIWSLSFSENIHIIYNFLKIEKESGIKTGQGLQNTKIFRFFLTVNCLKFQFSFLFIFDSFTIQVGDNAQLRMGTHKKVQ